MDPRSRKLIIIGCTASVIVAALAYGLWPKPIPVDVGKVVRRPMQVTLEEEGKTQVHDRFVIAAPVSGLLQRIELRPGDPLSKGKTLASILPVAPELLNERQYTMGRAGLSASQAALQQTKEQLEMASEVAAYCEKEYQRIKKLHDTGIGSDQVLEEVSLALRRARSAKSSAEFGVSIAEYDVKSAEAALKYVWRSQDPNEVFTLQSPVDGVVLSVPSQSEHPVQPGESLMEVGDPRSLEIRADVLSSDAVMIRPSMRVIIRKWGGVKTLEGYVRRVEPAGYTKVSALGVEEQRVPVIIDLTSPPQEWQELGDGFQVVTEFILWHDEDVLQIPTSALFRSGNEWAVFSVNSNHALQRTVKVGHQSGLFSEILEGLSEEEYVLTHPDERIKDGVKVRMRVRD